MSDSLPKTVFCDIDGVIFRHTSPVGNLCEAPRMLRGVKKTFARWMDRGHCIVLTTGRPNSLRGLTELQLRNAGLPYHYLIMGLPRGARVVINDMKPDGTKTAAAYNLARNEGMEKIDV